MTGEQGGHHQEEEEEEVASLWGAGAAKGRGKEERGRLGPLFSQVVLGMDSSREE